MFLKGQHPLPFIPPDSPSASSSAGGGEGEGANPRESEKH
jgi:hypothetical protein